MGTITAEDWLQKISRKKPGKARDGHGLHISLLKALTKELDVRAGRELAQRLKGS